jgi:hypothetical protein
MMFILALQMKIFSLLKRYIEFPRIVCFPVFDREANLCINEILIHSVLTYTSDLSDV